MKKTFLPPKNFSEMFFFLLKKCAASQKKKLLHLKKKKIKKKNISLNFTDENVISWKKNHMEPSMHAVCSLMLADG